MDDVADKLKAREPLCLKELLGLFSPVRRPNSFDSVHSQFVEAREAGFAFRHVSLSTATLDGFDSARQTVGDLLPPVGDVLPFNRPLKKVDQITLNLEANSYFDRKTANGRLMNLATFPSAKINRPFLR